MGPPVVVIAPNVVTAVWSASPVTAEASSVPPVVISPEPVTLIACGDVIVTLPVPVVTGPVMPMPPPPVWSKVIEEAPDVVSDVIETAVPDVLLMSMGPAVVSAETKKAASSMTPVVPIPVVAFKSTVLAVILLIPAMSPLLAVSVTVLPVAVIGLERTMFWPEVSVTLPVVVIALGTAMPHTLVTLMSPAAEVIVAKPCETLALALIPVLATSEPV